MPVLVPPPGPKVDFNEGLLVRAAVKYMGSANDIIHKAMYATTCAWFTLPVCVFSLLTLSAADTNSSGRCSMTLLGKDGVVDRILRVYLTIRAVNMSFVPLHFAARRPGRVLVGHEVRTN